ncbi:META domain-containing protein [Glaciihabitans arcticus]|uniref:META domain-containing protein n=1 Tax=Glaciihabitans arcticus TaxID=2668039 RepID=A0A4Q9GUD4_9MICO|nr:META domain-containing protein [Glaciihabitans arcticus]TBN56173.1 META domain-containing protein [Glaciihabitans arcticus]
MKRLVSLAALLLFVTGCAATAPASPGGVSSDPSKLVGVWRVSDAAGAGADTWLRLADDVMVWSDCGVSSGSWTARGSALLVDIYSQSDDSCLLGRVFDPTPWLSQATGYRETNTGMALLDSGGSVVANLTIDGAPPTSEQYLDEYTEQPTETVEFEKPAHLPEGVTAPKDIVGRWIDPAHPADGTFIEFAGDGTYEGSDGCNGVSGRYSYAPDGSLLATQGLTTLMGCEGSAIADLASTSPLVGVAGEGLAFYSAAGDVAITVVRD